MRFHFKYLAPAFQIPSWESLANANTTFDHKYRVWVFSYYENKKLEKPSSPLTFSKHGRKIQNLLMHRECIKWLVHQTKCVTTWCQGRLQWHSKRNIAHSQIATLIELASDPLSCSNPKTQCVSPMNFITPILVFFSYT